MSTSFELPRFDEPYLGDDAFGADGPTQSEQLDQMAQAGDVQGIWRYLSSTFERTFLGPCWDLIDLEKGLQCLTRACEVASRTNPAKFSAQLHTQMTSVTAALVMRFQFHLLNAMSEHDRQVSKKVSSEALIGMFSDLLPALADIQRNLAEMFQLQAQTARSWELTLDKRASNKRRKGNPSK